MASAAKRAAVEASAPVAQPASPLPPTTLTIEPPAAPAMASPALALQAELAARLSDDIEPGWSRRRTIAFAFAASAVLWVGAVAFCAAILG